MYLAHMYMMLNQKKQVSSSFILSSGMYFSGKIYKQQRCLALCSSVLDWIDLALTVPCIVCYQLSSFVRFITVYLVSLFLP